MRGRTGVVHRGMGRRDVDRLTVDGARLGLPAALVGRRRRVALAVVVAAGLATGCTAADTPDSTRSASTSTSADVSESPSPSPTPSFGSDLTMPTDGVGTAPSEGADMWTLANEPDNIYATVVAPPGASALTTAQQSQVATWLDSYRARANASASAPSEPTATASGTTTDPTTATPEQTATSTQDQTASATQDQTASATQDENAADSFRVVSQLLVARTGIAGVRLYARTTVGGVATASWRTFWFDGSSGEVVSGAEFFAAPAGGGADPLGTARRLVSEAGGDVGAVSDRDLFAAAAFTTSGDLLLYLPGADGQPAPVTLKKAQIEPLLSPLGRQAQQAAADAQ